MNSYKTETHKHREQTCGYRGEGGSGREGLGLADAND